MKGQCGENFKPYTSYCENCKYYDYCLKALKECAEQENSPGDNYPLRPFEEDIQKNKIQFKDQPPISEVEVLFFRDVINDITINKFIKVLELYS